MGNFVNPGNTQFVDDISSKIYVDKSDMVVELNDYYRTVDKYICMSRARRFGKTMMTNLLVAYYSKGCDSRALFEKLKLSRHEGWDKHLNNVNVISIDVNSEYSDLDDKLSFVPVLQQNVVDELRDAFPNVALESENTIASAITKIFNSTGEAFVFIMDEYDVLFRDKEVDKSVRESYLAMLNALFKSNKTTKAINLAYLTGILPIIREQVQSKLNNFNEFTMLDPKAFAPYFGFTEQEVKELCQTHNMDYERCAAMYDGYFFSGIGHIFNPNSVSKCIRNRDYDSYWNYTSSFDAITCYIEEDMLGIQDDIRTMLEGGEICINTDLYKNNITNFDSKDKVFTYLIHLGYLALVRKGVKNYCRIPNNEVKIEWFNAMQDAQRFKSIYNIIEPSIKVLSATENCDSAAVATALDYFHTQYSSSLTYNLESSMQSAILMAYFYANRDYMVFAELPTGQGFADVAFIPLRRESPAIIVELKKDGEPQVAIDQIKSRNYAQAFKKHPGQGVLLVGITYDPKEHKHKCIIEKVEDYKEVWK